MNTPIEQNPRIAIILMLTATSFIAGTTLLAKAIGTGALGTPLHPLQISHGRYVFAFVALISAAAVLRPKFNTIHWGLHLRRTFFGWLGVTLMFASVAFIPLSDATAISFLNPIFAMMFAIPLLGEKVGPVRWSAAAIALVGALVLLRPGTESLQIGALIALGAALLLGLEVVFIKQLTGREKPFQILIINNAVGLAISSAAVVPFFQWPTMLQWGALAGIGVLMACAQTCYLNAVARAEASFIVPFSYMTLVMAAIYDALIFNVIPGWVSLLGAGIIIAGAALLAWREAGLKASNDTQS